MLNQTNDDTTLRHQSLENSSRKYLVDVGFETFFLKCRVERKILTHNWVGEYIVDFVTLTHDSTVLDSVTVQ